MRNYSDSASFDKHYGTSKSFENAATFAETGSRKIRGGGGTGQRLEIRGFGNVLIFINGCFLAAFTAVSVSLILQNYVAKPAGDFYYIAFYLFCICLALLVFYAGRFLENIVINSTNRVIVLCASLGFALAGAAITFVGNLNEFTVCLSLALTVIAICLNAFIWFTFLTTIEHSRILMFFDFCFGLSAPLICLNQVGTAGLALLCALFAVVFFALFVGFTNHHFDIQNFPVIAQPKNMSKQIRLNRAHIPSLLAAGVLVGFPLASLLLQTTGDLLFYLLATSLMLSGLLFSVIKLKFLLKLESFFFRFTPLIFCFGAFLYPFTDGILRQASSVYLLTFAFAQLFITIDAILESPRIYKISPVRLISSQITSIFVGLAVIMALTALIDKFFESNYKIVAQIFLAVLIVLFLGYFLPKTGYPNTGALQSGDDTDVQRHPRWKDTFDAIAINYNLSPREREVFELLAKGHSTPAIANTLYIATSTTRTHVAKIYSKMEIHSKEDLLDVLQKTRETL